MDVIWQRLSIAREEVVLHSDRQDEAFRSEESRWIGCAFGRTRPQEGRVGL